MYQPKCECLQCSYSALVYSSIHDFHRCLECDLNVEGQHLDGLILGFAIRNADPMFVQNFNRLYCLSCVMTGGIYFRKLHGDIVYCDLCKTDLYIDKLLDVQANAYKTKLIEKSYNFIFPVVRGT